MLLVDTSIWIDHLHQLESSLADALHGSMVGQHPMVVGELALGALRDRAAFLELLANLPEIQVATHGEVMHLVEERQLYGQGLSFVDAHLLASTLLTSGARLWTRDKRLLKNAQALGIAYSPDD
ncbi:MAG: type II toxin-antitoxin system VapC family toxin [Nocardioidaceae bacterium]|nr:type II toxin-antitoxin system VapC family toxin [Nocardioidaceae bacterium]